MKNLKYHHYSYMKAFSKLHKELTALSPVKWDGRFIDSLKGTCYATACKDQTRYFKDFFSEKSIVFIINNYE